MRPKICVPVVEMFRDSIAEEMKRVAALPVQMAEWRVDFFAGYELEITDAVEELKKILGEKELVVTLRTEYEGGEENGSRFSYFQLIRRIREQGVADYVDAEIRRDRKTLEKLLAETADSPVKVIGSYHDFEKTPDADFICGTLREAREIGCHAGKFACMPHGREDVERLLRATEEVKSEAPDFPLITMSMGGEGAWSRLYGGLYGSEISFGSAGHTSAPGQVHYGRMNEVFDRIYSGKKHIVLIGFMGSGKSTVSKALRRLCGCAEIDTDRYIEQQENMTIPQIFEKYGEEYFRQKECEMIDGLSGLSTSVISCGGGMPLRDLNAKKLGAVGEVVFLTAEPETVYGRVKDDGNRPLLEGNMNVEFIRGLMEERRPYYERAASVCVATDGRSPDDIAREIWERCGGVCGHLTTALA